MPTHDDPWTLDDARGGQNSADPPYALAKNQVVSAVNCEWFRASVARKRRGSRLSERDGASALPTNEPFVTLVGSPYASHTGYQGLIQGGTSFDFVSWGTAAPTSDWESGTGINDVGHRP